MKKIELKKTIMPIGEDLAEGVTLDYRVQLQSLLLVPKDQEKGTNYEEMVEVLPIHDKLKTADQFVLLEDAEHKVLVSRLKTARFRQNTPEIRDMIQSVIDAPDHLVKAQEA